MTSAGDTIHGGVPNRGRQSPSPFHFRAGVFRSLTVYVIRDRGGHDEIAAIH